MKAWPLLLPVMLLALTTLTTLGHLDADSLDKDERQVKTQAVDEKQDEDQGKNLYGLKRKRRFLVFLNNRFEGDLIDKFQNWAREKFKKFMEKIINTKLELDGDSLSDELKEKLIEEIMTALTDIWNHPEKRIAEIVAEIYWRYVRGTVTTGQEKEKPVESGKP